MRSVLPVAPESAAKAAGIVQRTAAPDLADVGRKLRQHDHELEAVYDLLSVVDGKVDILEAKVDAGFARLESGQPQILDLLHGRREGDSTPK